MSDTQKRLLSIDGGGLRGMIALRVLARIEAILREQSGKPNIVLADYFDYIGGTSTGGIIAAALAIGMSVSEIEHFYRHEAQRLFSPNRNPVKHLLYARYNSKPLKETLQQVFGVDTTLGSDRLKTLLLLVLLNAGTTSPWPISSNPMAKYNDPAFGSENNLKLPLWQLVRASTAAPYYFEPEEVQVGQNRFLFYDGGLTSLNNPAFKLFQMATLPCYNLQWQTGADRMLLVSVGTGLIPKGITKLGLLEKQLGTTMINAMHAMMCASTAEVDMLCRSFGCVLAGEPIDSEVGDFVGNTPVGGTPLFTYLRYNALLTEKGLAPLGCAGLLAKTNFRLDDIKAIEPCAEVGDAIAELRVNPAHFTDFPMRNV
jgi:hypothetical protein